MTAHLLLLLGALDGGVNERALELVARHPQHLFDGGVGTFFHSDGCPAASVREVAQSVVELELDNAPCGSHVVFPHAISRVTIVNAPARVVSMPSGDELRLTGASICLGKTCRKLARVAWVWRWEIFSAKSGKWALVRGAGKLGWLGNDPSPHEDPPDFFVDLEKKTIRSGKFSLFGPDAPRSRCKKSEFFIPRGADWLCVPESFHERAVMTRHPTTTTCEVAGSRRGVLFKVTDAEQLLLGLIDVDACAELMSEKP